MRERLEEMQMLLLRIQKDDTLPINMKIQSLKADIEITKLLVEVIEYDNLHKK